MFCLGIFLPREHRTKLVGWHFVDQELVSQKLEDQIAADGLEALPASAVKSTRSDRRAVLLSRARLKMRVSFRRILEKMMASRETNGERGSLWLKLQRRPDQLTRAEHELPRSPQHTDDHGITGPIPTAGETANGGLSGPPAKSEGSHSDNGLLETAAKILSQISTQIYRDELLLKTEQRMMVWSSNEALPSQSELEQQFPRLPEPVADGSGRHLQWNRLREYFDLLDNEVKTLQQLWQVYLFALQSFNCLDLYATAYMMYKSLYGGDRTDARSTGQIAYEAPLGVQHADAAVRQTLPKRVPDSERPSFQLAELRNFRESHLFIPTMSLLGNIGRKKYRSAALYQTRERIPYWTARHHPSAKELEHLLPLPPEPTESHTIDKIEWQYLQKYVDFLNNEVSSEREMWQIYLAALESFGYDAAQRRAQTEYSLLSETGNKA